MTRDSALAECMRCSDRRGPGLACSTNIYPSHTRHLSHLYEIPPTAILTQAIAKILPRILAPKV